MRYKVFGRSGLRVSELCLGAMTFGEDFGWGASEEESRRIFERFVESGGNFIDTANHYTRGTSEKFLGRFVQESRERFVLSTKYTLCQHPDDVNAGGNHRKNMVQSLEESLTRLGTDYIDVYWVHAWDGMTPVEEMMRALDDLVRAGKVLYVGISDTPAWVVSQATMLADLRGWSRFVGLQIQYSLIERTPERELLPMANALDLAVTAWSVLGFGVLTGKYSSREEDPGEARLTEGKWGDAYVTDRALAIADTVVEVASEIGRSPAQVAINWLRAQQTRATVIPILGARTASQLDDNLGCLDFELESEQLAKLDQASAIELGFPHDFLAQENVLDLVHSPKRNLLDR